MARHLLARRAILVGGTAVLTCAALPGRVRAATPADATYAIYLKGDRIGAQELRFSSNKGGFEATSSLKIAVKVMGLTAFSFQQEAHETWRGGNLVKARITTDDDGKKSEVRIDSADGRLVINGPHGRIKAPPGAKTDLSFWNEAIVDQKQLIDSQKGDLIAVTFTGPDKVTLAQGGASMTATRYKVATDNGKKSGSLFYDQDRRLVRSTLRTRGKELNFQLIG